MARSDLCRAWVCACIVVAAAFSSASAQNQQPSAGEGFSGGNSAKGIAREQGTSAAPPALPFGTLDLGNGFSFLLNYTGEFAANPSGGLRQGADFAGQLFVGADADLHKIAGIPDASAHLILTDRQGRNLQTDAIGNDTAVQEIYGTGQTYRLTSLTYEQRLFADHLDLEAGRTQAENGFLVSPIYCDFQNNATCGAPVTIFKITNFSYFPVSTWGGHGKIWLDPSYRYFFHIGAFEVNPNAVRPEAHGFDWSGRGATGVVVPMELGYSTTPATDPLPRNYGIGAVIDESTYADPVRDIRGGASVFSGLPPASRNGRSAVYARFDQMVWRPDADATRGIILFGVGIAGTSGAQTQSFFLEGGAIWNGPLASRPYDTIGFDVSDQHYSASGLFNLRASAAAQGIDPSLFATDQIMMELNYGIQINPAVRLLPQLQYIINPTNTGAPYLTRPIPNAFVIGGKFSIDLFTLVGLARGPGSP